MTDLATQLWTFTGPKLVPPPGGSRPTATSALLNLVLADTGAAGALEYS